MLRCMSLISKMSVATVTFTEVKTNPVGVCWVFLKINVPALMMKIFQTKPDSL